MRNIYLLLLNFIFIIIPTTLILHFIVHEYNLVFQK